MALYLVATPIGNRQDISFRALDLLASADLILAEDTRKTRQLLDHYTDRTFRAPIERLDDHVRGARLARIVERIASGIDAVLVTCAGTPGVSDPGQSLIATCVDRGIPIVPVPGASAFAVILSVANFPVEPVAFFGFLPTKKGRQSELKRLKEATGKYGLASAVFYESPFRVQRLLKELSDWFGSDSRIVVGRELTKLYEEVWYGSIGEALGHFQKPKGEFTLLVRIQGPSVTAS